MPSRRIWQLCMVNLQKVSKVSWKYYWYNLSSISLDFRPKLQDFSFPKVWPFSYNCSLWRNSFLYSLVQGLAHTVELGNDLARARHALQMAIDTLGIVKTIFLNNRHYWIQVTNNARQQGTEGDTTIVLKVIWVYILLQYLYLKYFNKNVVFSSMTKFCTPGVVTLQTCSQDYFISFCF